MWGFESSSGRGFSHDAVRPNATAIQIRLRISRISSSRKQLWVGHIFFRSGASGRQKLVEAEEFAAEGAAIGGPHWLAGSPNYLVRRAFSSSISAINRRGDRNDVELSRRNISGRSIQPREVASSNTPKGTQSFQTPPSCFNAPFAVVHQEQRGGQDACQSDRLRFARIKIGKHGIGGQTFATND